MSRIEFQLGLKNSSLKYRYSVLSKHRDGRFYKKYLFQQ